MSISFGYRNVGRHKMNYIPLVVFVIPMMLGAIYMIPVRIK